MVACGSTKSVLELLTNEDLSGKASLRDNELILQEYKRKDSIEE